MRLKHSVDPDNLVASGKATLFGSSWFRRAGLIFINHFAVKKEENPKLVGKRKTPELC